MSFTRLIPLGRAPLAGAFLSSELVDEIGKLLSERKQILCLYNRRGSARSLICRDCGRVEMCPHCDIHLSYHTSPSSRLICHQCNYTTDIPSVCSECGGVSFTPMGIGVQRIEQDLSRLFPSARVVRLDSDQKREKRKRYLDEVDSADILIGTQMAVSTIDSRLAMVAFLMIDQDLSIPEYDREDRIYSQITLARRAGVPVWIQTYREESDFLHLVLHGNSREFITTTLAHRREFGYPPYTDLVYLWVGHQSQEMVRDIIYKLANKISHLITEFDDESRKGVFLSYDRDIWEKYAGEWRQKIVLKGKNLDSILVSLRVEILRNRSVWLERK